MKLTALVHEDEEFGFWGEIPAIPGCTADGKTIEELRTNLIEAAHACLEVANARYELAEGDQVIEIEV